MMLILKMMMLMILNLMMMMSSAITGRLWPLSAWALTINKEGGRPAMAQGFENFTLKMNLKTLR